MDEPGERLKAFCSLTFDDCFVVRDLKIIDGSNGPFVAMPSRKLTSHCPKCGMKNHFRAAYCNQCGGRLEESRAPKDADGRAKLYADIAHPINTACREMIQNFVIQEYYEEIELAKQPGYVSRYDDYDYDFVDTFRRSSARFDQPHAFPAVDQPHIAANSPSFHDASGSTKPHYQADNPSKRSNNIPRAESARGDTFGAGIFPG